MSAVKPVLSPLTRSALEAEAHVASEGWGQPPRLFALARNGELLRRQPALRSMLGNIDEDEFSAIEQEDALSAGDLEKALGSLAWPSDVDGVALAIERVVVLPSDAPRRQGSRQDDRQKNVGDADETTKAAADTRNQSAPQAEREDVRLLVAALRNGEIITLVRRKNEDSDDKVAIGTNIAPGLVEALRATLA